MATHLGLNRNKGHIGVFFWCVCTHDLSKKKKNIKTFETTEYHQKNCLRSTLNIYHIPKHTPAHYFMPINTAIWAKTRTLNAMYSHIYWKNYYSTRLGHVDYRFHGLYKVPSQPLKALARCWRPPLFPIPRTIVVGGDKWAMWPDQARPGRAKPGIVDRGVFLISHYFFRLFCYTTYQSIHSRCYIFTSPKNSSTEKKTEEW